MHYLTLYSLLQNKALRAFTGFTRHDIVLLQCLCVLNRPTLNKVLYSVMQDTYGTVSHTTYIDAMDKLTTYSYVTKNMISGHAMYELTFRGKALIEEYNRQLERLAKEVYNKYNIPSQLI